MYEIYNNFHIILATKRPALRSVYIMILKRAAVSNIMTRGKNMEV